MIVGKYKRLPQLVRYVGWPLLALLTWDIVVTAVYLVFHGKNFKLPEVPLPLLGSAVLLFVGFRNNAAYARWWEARTLWGAMVNTSRTYAREVAMLLDGPADDPLHRHLVHRHIAYVHALRCHLRRQDWRPALAGMLPAEELAPLEGRANVPVALLLGSGELLKQAARQGVLDSIRLRALAEIMRSMMDAQGGMERIKNTPLARQYVYFPKLFVQVFCVLLPLGIVPDLGLFTPIGSSLIGFMFLAIDTIGEDLQDPFEDTVHDVPMTTICRSIEIDLRQGLGEAAPPPVQPQSGVLW